MFGALKNSASKPTALGLMLSASTYGATIPLIIGTTRSNLLMTWLQNLRAGTPNKKLMAVIGGNTSGKKKGKKSPDYNANVDFLLGHNPILGVLQGWINQAKVPLNFPVVRITSGVPLTYTFSDPNFYALLGVTWTIPYSVVFNDYGGPGSQSLSGSFEVPLWNLAFNGPDPTNGMGYKQWPDVYEWTPAAGNVVTFPAGGATGDWPASVTSLNLYYAQTSGATFNENPAALMRLTFESSLGNGSEYGTEFANQRIIYPWYAGVSSPNFDFGPGAQMSPTSLETQGAYSLYPTGDADIVDMISHVVKSGTIQADLASAYNQSPLQMGLACADYPGPVQKAYYTRGEAIGAANNVIFRQPNQKGNILVCFAVESQGSAFTGVTSDSGETWTTLEAGTDGIYNWVLAYAISNGYQAGNTVKPQFSAGGFNNQVFATEWPLDTFDSFVGYSVTGAQAKLGTTPITTSNARGNPGCVMGFVIGAPPVGSPSLFDPRWKMLLNQGYIAYGQWRSLWAPGTVYLNDTWAASGSDRRVLLLALKQVAPASYPTFFNTIVGNILDDTSLEAVRTQDRAYGLNGSISMTSQKKGIDWLEQFYKTANAWPCWEGFVLKSIPLAEASAVGNGSIYRSPTAAGPVFNLSSENGDFISDADNPPLTIERTPQTLAPNILQMQIKNRASDYDDATISEPLSAAAANFGVRKSPPEVHEEITSTTVARSLLGVAARVETLLRDVVRWKGNAKQGLLGVGDVGLVSDPYAGINNLPVRITATEEAENHEISFEAEQFFYGVRTPNALIGPEVTQNLPGYYADPGSVNTPIIFEPVPRLYNNANQPQIWCVVSSPNANYGGCAVLLSTDGGASYEQIGTISGSAVTGVTTGDWPIASDPDTTNNLPVDLTESLGALSSYAASDRDNFTYPCYIAGGNAVIPYGLLTYNMATLTSAFHYTLLATGTGNALRRCVFGAPVAQPGPDVDHPNGSRFAFLSNASLAQPSGIIKINVDPSWIGKTLFFKFLAVNSLGGSFQAQAAATAYSFTPSGAPSGGVPQNSQYTQVPPVALTQPTGTTIHMAAVTVKFGTNSVNYNARTFTITNPSVPTIYYVTIADPGQIGDTGNTTNLTATCQTSNALAGAAGNTFIGFIQAVPGGGAAAIASAGGWPQPPGAVITG